MPHCKNTQTIRENSKSFEKNSEKAMNEIVSTVEALTKNTSPSNKRISLLLSDKGQGKYYRNNILMKPASPAGFIIKKYT